MYTLGIDQMETRLIKKNLFSHSLVLQKPDEKFHHHVLQNKNISVKM